MVKGTISKITKNGNVKIFNENKGMSEDMYDSGTHLSQRPEEQIVLIESRTRKVLVEKLNV